MTAGQASFPVVAPPFQFERYGEHGTWVSELLPHTASVADDLCILKGVHTDAINHDPGITFINTGDQQPGKASLGSTTGLSSKDTARLMLSGGFASLGTGCCFLGWLVVKRTKRPNYDDGRALVYNTRNLCSAA